MFTKWLRNGSVAAALVLSSAHAPASTPAENPLLRLIPANVEIVSGIEDPHHGDQSGRLLIVTHNDNVDLRDWITLASVDDRQQVDRLIEVAASSPRGELSEHLLLARGTFAGRHILDAASDNGGTGIRYAGTRVVELKPFAREQQEMQDTRWLAVPDDHTVIFGSPVMVKVALDRYAVGAHVDNELMQRVNKLAPDVNCWSLLTMPGAVMVTHMLPGVLDATNEALMHGVTSLTVSVHYGAKERVDFAFAAENADTATVLAAAIRGPGHVLPATETLHSQLEQISVRGNELRGSVRVAEKEFDPWLAGLRERVLATANREPVTQIAAGR
jgi:hypothetical protein